MEKNEKKKKLNVLHPIGIQRSRYEYIWLLIWSKERWVVWGKGGGVGWEQFEFESRWAPEC